MPWCASDTSPGVGTWRPRSTLHPPSCGGGAEPGASWRRSHRALWWAVCPVPGAAPCASSSPSYRDRCRSSAPVGPSLQLIRPSHASLLSRATGLPPTPPAHMASSGRRSPASTRHPSALRRRRDPHVAPRPGQVGYHGTAQASPNNVPGVTRAIRSISCWGMPAFSSCWTNS